MNIPSLSSEQMRQLLKIAAARTGTTPEALAGTVREGGYSGLLQSLSVEDRRTLSTLVEDPQRAEAFLNSPEVYALLRQITESGT